MEKTGSASIAGSIFVNLSLWAVSATWAVQGQFLTRFLSRGLMTPSSEHRSSHSPMYSVLLSPFSIATCHTLLLFTLKTHVPDVCITLLSVCQFFSPVTILETFCAMPLQSMPPVSSHPHHAGSTAGFALHPQSLPPSQVEPLGLTVPRSFRLTLAPSWSGLPCLCFVWDGFLSIQ
jgi:hypothetical protein